MPDIDLIRLPPPHDKILALLAIVVIRCQHVFAAELKFREDLVAARTALKHIELADDAEVETAQDVVSEVADFAGRMLAADGGLGFGRRESFVADDAAVGAAYGLVPGRQRVSAYAAGWM